MALVITIIILLILAGITIASLTGSGLFENARLAEQKSNEAQEKEDEILSDYENKINNELNKNKISTVIELKESNETIGYDIIIKDTSQNEIMIKKGFKLANDSGLTVQEGIVLQDESGNEYVWIPVSKDSTKVIYKDDGTSFVNILARRNFDESNPIIDEEGTAALTGYLGAYYTETVDNSTAENLTDFKNKVKENGGFYIARYETGKDEDDNPVIKSSPTGVYNNVSKEDAKDIAVDFSEDYISDLVNSFAWDTMLNYMKECGEDFDPTEIKAYGGAATVNYQEDACKIYDVVSNHSEFSTEYTSYPGFINVALGGNYTGQYGSDSAKGRSPATQGYASEANSFRIILYW